MGPGLIYYYAPLPIRRGISPYHRRRAEALADVNRDKPGAARRSHHYGDSVRDKERLSNDIENKPTVLWSHIDYFIFRKENISEINYTQFAVLPGRCSHGYRKYPTTHLPAGIGASSSTPSVIRNELL